MKTVHFESVTVVCRDGEGDEVYGSARIQVPLTPEGIINVSFSRNGTSSWGGGALCNGSALLKEAVCRALSDCRSRQMSLRR